MKWDLDEPYLKGKGPMMKLPKSNNVMRRHLRRSRVPEVSPNSRMNCVGNEGDADIVNAEPYISCLCEQPFLRRELERQTTRMSNTQGY